MEKSEINDTSGIQKSPVTKCVTIVANSAASLGNNVQSYLQYNPRQYQISLFEEIVFVDSNGKEIKNFTAILIYNTTE